MLLAVCLRVARNLSVLRKIQAWETDTCGCCNQTCPQHPHPVVVNCSAVSSSSSLSADGTNVPCHLKYGQDGVFVCRTYFQPFDEQVEERVFCIPPDRAWVTDVCGCCPSGCPAPRQGGFADETTQMAALALSIPDNYAISGTATSDANSGGSHSASLTNNASSSGSAILGVGGIVMWAMRGAASIVWGM